MAFAGDSCKSLNLQYLKLFINDIFHVSDYFENPTNAISSLHNKKMADFGLIENLNVDSLTMNHH